METHSSREAIAMGPNLMITLSFDYGTRAWKQGYGTSRADRERIALNPAASLLPKAPSRGQIATIAAVDAVLSF
jgi:hypothetical protein